jgi:Domain of unknown function (DUF1840)
MIYKFKSKASGDTIMLGPHGDQLLRLLGREPAAKGIFEPADMPALLQRLTQAIAEAEAPPEGGDDAENTAAVGLRQRLWPMIEMLRRCQAAGEPIVWGV